MIAIAILTKPEKTGADLANEYNEVVGRIAAETADRKDVVASRLASLEAEFRTLKELQEQVGK